MHNDQFRRKIVEKLPFFANFSPKMTYVRQKCVPWRSNQEWRSIGADTVYREIQTNLAKITPVLKVFDENQTRNLMELC